MNRKSRVTPREKFLIARARRLDPELRSVLAAMRATYLTDEAFRADLEVLYVEMVGAVEQGHLNALWESVDALYESWKLGLAV